MSIESSGKGAEEKKANDKSKMGKAVGKTESNAPETMKDVVTKETKKEGEKGESGRGLTECLVERGAVREMLLSGDFTKAEAFLQTCFRDIWDDNPNIRLSLAALQFIERVRLNQPLDAIRFAQDRLLRDELEKGRFVSRDAGGFERLMEAEELFQLLCYQDLGSSGFQYLLSPVQREAVSDYINAKIMQRGDRASSALETSVQQLLLNESFRLEKANMLGPQFTLKI
jgi:hypothetical protein